MPTLIDFLSEARSAYQRNDWHASYAAFVRADELGAMPTNDLEAYSTAAWRIGRSSEAVRLAERAYDRLVRTDPAGAAMKAADSTDPAKYMPALAKIKYDGITANISFDAKGDLTQGLLTIFEVKNGKWEVVSK